MPGARRFDRGIEYQNDSNCMRFTVAQTGIIRLQYVRGHQFSADGFYAAVQVARPAAPFQFTSQGATDSLSTSELKVEIERSPLRVSFLDGQGQVFKRDADALRMETDPDGRVRVWKDPPPDAHFFGFGEKSGFLDKRGVRSDGSSLAMWNSGKPGYDNTMDPL